MGFWICDVIYSGFSPTLLQFNLLNFILFFLNYSRASELFKTPCVMLPPYSDQEVDQTHLESFQFEYAIFFVGFIGL